MPANVAIDHPRGETYNPSEEHVEQIGQNVHVNSEL